MKETTAEWVNKAETDYDAACILRRSRKRTRFDPVCFHCQQCDEKYLKAQPNEPANRFSKTHDLGALLDQLRTIEPLWLGMRIPIESLTQYAVLIRYPNMSTDGKKASSAFSVCTKMRSLARASLGLKP
jgi:HEPN domain-containing protein